MSFSTGNSAAAAHAAYQYNPTSPLSHNDAFEQWNGLDRELPELSACIIGFQIEPGGDDTLVLVQLHHDDAGARTDVEHRLLPTDWIVQNKAADGGYEVMTDEQFQAAKLRT